MADNIINPSTASAEELDIAELGPAVLINRFYASITAAGVRVAFTEVYSPERLPQFRTAVCMSVQDAVALCRLLRVLLRDIDPQVDSIV